ncbi:hypothetical protein KC19_VG108900 [Ceratodon purpureus]|uniref:Secreted protein n=1 Tax=Ceratodon purpureus TaxID=3225 RepID=A0A8T0HP74_CERPU|nr:hypothetical protein KC19_VG108900 [Ceratodon purpureus]
MPGLCRLLSVSLHTILGLELYALTTFDSCTSSMKLLFYGLSTLQERVHFILETSWVECRLSPQCTSHTFTCETKTIRKQS